MNNESQLSIKNYKTKKNINKTQKNLFELIKQLFNSTIDTYQEISQKSLANVLEDFVSGINYLIEQLDGNISKEEQLNKLLDSFNFENTKHLVELSNLLEAKVMNHSIMNQPLTIPDYLRINYSQPHLQGVEDSFDVRDLKEVINHAFSFLFTSIQRHIDSVARNEHEESVGIIDGLLKGTISRIEQFFIEFDTNGDNEMTKRLMMMSQEYSEVRRGMSTTLTNIVQIEKGIKNIQHLDSDLLLVNGKLIDSTVDLSKKVVNLKSDAEEFKIDIHNLIDMQKNELDQNEQILTSLKEFQKDQWKLKDRINRDRVNSLLSNEDQKNNRRKKEPIDIEENISKTKNKTKTKEKVLEKNTVDKEMHRIPEKRKRKILEDKLGSNDEIDKHAISPVLNEEMSIPITNTRFTELPSTTSQSTTMIMTEEKSGNDFIEKTKEQQNSEPYESHESQNIGAEKEETSQKNNSGLFASIPTYLSVSKSLSNVSNSGGNSINYSDIVFDSSKKEKKEKKKEKITKQRKKKSKTPNPFLTLASVPPKLLKNTNK
eukprot:TRINITY_DN1289_c0_g1_i1.p1 TRINITY_DN1289_c0_g1~~TRINITY_DN1289_c0_g1_i1.p1  ORF type:complete len:591 (+),score=178.88 TRINITY_DN1289_c0_g1_i1:145-1773(+)